MDDKPEKTSSLNKDILDALLENDEDYLRYLEMKIKELEEENANYN